MPVVDFKKIYVKIFHVFRDDEELLKLLEIDRASFTDENKFIHRLRKQVSDMSTPSDMLNDYSTKLCIHEYDGSYRDGVQDVNYLAIDIHTTQDKDAVDRRHLKIIKRVIELLDTVERKKQGLPPLNIGLEGLVYKSRPNTNYASTGWEKHTVLFEYKFLTNIV